MISVQQLKKKNKDRVFLIGILLVAALLRIPYLSSYPVGFHADEAAMGYDAYSLLKTGRDQYGEFLPLYTRSFGDYDEALYRYFAVPFVWALGLTEEATRLPAAVAGVLTVWALFGLVRTQFGVGLAHLSALVLAISPWHVQLSRWGIRAILLPLFFCLGLQFFLKALKKSPYLLLSTFSFGICLVTYPSARVFLPPFLVGLCFFYWRDLLKMRIWLWVSVAVFFALLGTLVPHWISPEGMRRAHAELGTNPLLVALYYLSYFSPEFLFFSGDPNLRHCILNIGQLNHFEMILIPVGIWGLIRQKEPHNRVLWLWLVLYPVPAGLTESYHSVRAIVGAPLFAILSAYGFESLKGRIPLGAKKAFCTGSAIVMVFHLGMFCILYLDAPFYTVGWWHYGMKEAIAEAEQSSLPCIISDQIDRTPAYIFVLFFTRYDPAAYHRLPLHLRKQFWEYTREPLLGRYYILQLQNLVLRGTTCLVLIRPEELIEIIKKGYDWQDVHTVYDPFGKEMLKLIEVTGPS